MSNAQLKASESRSFSDYFHSTLTGIYQGNRGKGVPMGRNYRDEDWLEEQYHGKGLTQREIAEECGVSPRTIRKYMKRFGIETREVIGENHGLYGKERRGQGEDFREAQRPNVFGGNPSAVF